MLVNHFKSYFTSLYGTVLCDITAKDLLKLKQHGENVKGEFCK